MQKKEIKSVLISIDQNLFLIQYDIMNLVFHSTINHLLHPLTTFMWQRMIILYGAVMKPVFNLRENVTISTENDEDLKATRQVKGFNLWLVFVQFSFQSFPFCF